MNDQISFDALSRPAMVNLLRQVIEDDPAALFLLQPAKGESLEASISMLLAAASSDGRSVFASALGDVAQSYLDRYGEEPQQGDSHLTLRVLDLVEVGLNAGVRVESAPLIGVLSSLVEADDPDLVEAAARQLSNFPSPDALAILEDLYLKRSSNPTIASYLIDARTRSDPLSALELAFDDIHWNDFADVPELSLSIQAAVWAMFADDPRRAATKLRLLARRWPRALSSVVLGILQDPPLTRMPAAIQTARELGRAGQLVDELKQAPSGTAKRILDKTARTLDCIEGYSLSVAEGSGTFKSYKELWMERFADEVCRVLMETFPDVGDLKPSFKPWPTGVKWGDIFDRVRIGRADDPEDPLPTTDICFEMFYIDDSRSNRFDVVQLGKLKTFSVLFHQSNHKIRRILDEINSKEGKLSDIRRFLGQVKALDEPYIDIYCLIWNVAGDVVRERAWRGDWDLQRLRLQDSPTDIVRVIENSPQSAIVICDNVTANDMLGRSDRPLDTRRLRYPEPISVGLVVDASDGLWSDILYKALGNIAMDPDPALKASLRKHLVDLGSIDVEVTGDLARAFALPGRESAVDPAEEDAHGRS